MKKLIALALSLIVVLSLCACTGDNAGEPEKKDEKVTVSLLRKLAVSDDYQNTSAIVEYDEDYNLIGIKWYDNDRLVREVLYDKDVSRPLVEREYDEEGYYDSCTEYTYDKDGKVLTELADNSECSYTYNADGRVETKVTIWYDGDERRISYTYDDHGNLLTESVGYPNPDWDYINTYEYTYDNGKITEMKMYCDDALVSYIQYDSDGNEILSIDYVDGEEFERTETIYETGKLIKRVGYTLGEEDSRQENAYDKDGKLTEEVLCLNGDQEIRTTYTYNENGELIGKSRYEDGELEGEYTLTYETVTVSKEQAEMIGKMDDPLALI